MRPTYSINIIQPSQIDEAKRVIYTVARVIFGDQIPLEELIIACEANHELPDMDDIQENYFNNGGTFLVMTCSGRVIGTGALRRLAEKTCELKRLWLLTEYHGQGLGYRMVQELFSTARSKGYQTIRLETDPVHQHRAVAFYKKLGFFEIPRYGSDPGEISMERLL